MSDPMTAAKRDLEERDRIKMLADDARAILNRFEDWEGWPHEELIRALMRRGFSDPEARTVLDYIDWEDNRHDGETDP